MTVSSETYNVRYSDLPDVLPVFPLAGVILLPQGHLPLHIFEKRYIAMINDALRTDRLIGIVQPQDHKTLLRTGPKPLHKVGCVGKIIEYAELPDGRYHILLRGLWRFDVVDELPPQNHYRRIRPDWQNYAADTDVHDHYKIDREKLCGLVKRYLDKHDLTIDCAQLENASDGKLITTLSMLCPFDALDKQALVEAPTGERRAEMFMGFLEMYGLNETCNSLH